MKKYYSGLVYLLFLSLMIMSCVEEPLRMDRVSNISLTNEEMAIFSHYTNENKRIPLEQAENTALSFNYLTRSLESNIMNTDVLLKPNSKIYNDSISNLLPDTLVYLVSTDDGYCIAISADNRAKTRILGRIPQKQLYGITDEISWNIRDMICQMFTNTIISEICDYESKKDSVKAMLLKKLNLPENVVTRGLQNPYYTPDDYDFYTVYGSTTHNLVAICNPMTPWSWDQHMPYNNFVRYKQPCGSVPTGCVPLAMGLIMTYWGHPTSVDGHSMNWNLMRDTFTYSDTILTGAIDIAYLMQRIGEGINTNYQCDHSGANLNDGISWFHNHGYQGGYQSDFDYNSVKNSLSYGRPVLMYGQAEKQNGEIVGHAWVIDGYKEERDDIQTFLYARHKRTGQVFLVHEGVVHDYKYYLCNNFGNCNAGTWVSSTNYSNFQFIEFSSNFQYNLTIYTDIRPY